MSTLWRQCASMKEAAWLFVVLLFSSGCAAEKTSTSPQWLSAQDVSTLLEGGVDLVQTDKVQSSSLLS